MCLKIEVNKHAKLVNTCMIIKIYNIYECYIEVIFLRIRIRYCKIANDLYSNMHFRLETLGYIDIRNTLFQLLFEL